MDGQKMVLRFRIMEVWAFSMDLVRFFSGLGFRGFLRCRIQGLKGFRCIKSSGEVLIEIRKTNYFFQDAGYFDFQMDSDDLF